VGVGGRPTVGKEKHGRRSCFCDIKQASKSSFDATREATDVG
jgi:hypothetical protein